MAQHHSIGGGNWHDGIKDNCHKCNPAPVAVAVKEKVVEETAPKKTRKPRTKKVVV